MKNRSSTTLFIVLVFLVPLLAYAGYSLYERNFQKLPVYGKETIQNGIKKDHTVSSILLTNQDGEMISDSQWENRIVVADFFFTHCPSICPKMTNSLKRVQGSFSKNEILINSFSVDPERDSAAQLKWYAQKFGISTGNWQLLTGDKKEIYRLARNGFMIVATDGDGGPNDFIHSEKLILLDKQKRIRGYYDGTNEREVTKLIHDIKKLKNEN